MTSNSPRFPTKQLSRLTNHNGPVHAVTFSAGTGQYILTGCQDRNIRLFNPLSGRLIQTYSAHGYEVLDLGVSEDNARFASGGGDKTVFLWDVATAQTLRRFTGHSARINCVAFGGEGDSVVISGSFDGTVKVWDAKSRSEKPIMSFGEAKDSISSVAVCNNEIFVGSVDGCVRVYDLSMGCVDTDYVAPGKGVTNVTPTKAGDGYLVSSLDGKLRFFDRATGKCLQTFGDESFRNETYRLRSTLAMGEAYAVSGTEDGRVLVWDVLTGVVAHRIWHKEQGSAQSIASKKDVVSAVVWNQLRKLWASAGGDGTVVIRGMDD
ncbi:putative WD40/YVTN repeat-like-containing domain superfamily [Septoria linicola]|nr:putative WD40/YVTN repeat-like-containing domain superfamily [Septoria linicola]